MIRIVTDSTADLHNSYTQENNIKVVPLVVMFGQERFKDGVDISTQEFYDKMAASEKLPTTSQPSPEEFLEVFNDAKQCGDDIICITISSELSGTFQSASIAKQEADYENIYIIDSKNVTLAEALLVKLAVKLVNEGKSAKEISSELIIAREHVHLFAIVDNLTNLRKGGRLSGAAAVAGSLLGIKPVIGINTTLYSKGENDGKVSVVGKARGLAGAYVNVFKLIEEMGGVSNKFSTVHLGYAGSKTTATPFIQYFENNLNLKPEEPLAIGAVVGTHAGHGCAGIAFFDSEYA